MFVIDIHHITQLIDQILNESVRFRERIVVSNYDRIEAEASLNELIEQIDRDGFFLVQITGLI